MYGNKCREWMKWLCKLWDCKGQPPHVKACNISLQYVYVIYGAGGQYGKKLC